MTTSRGGGWYAAGAWVLIVLGATHSMAVLNEPVAANDTERQLFDLMRSYKQNLMGSMRSTGDLVLGFNLAFTLLSVALGGLNLAVRASHRGNTAALRPLALVNVAWLVTMVANSLWFWFAAPTAFLVAALLCFAIAWLRLQRTV